MTTTGHGVELAHGNRVLWWWKLEAVPEIEEGNWERAQLRGQNAAKTRQNVQNVWVFPCAPHPLYY
jgi:hypothetical protein